MPSSSGSLPYGPGRWYTDGLTYSLLALQLCATHTLEATKWQTKWHSVSNPSCSYAKGIRKGFPWLGIVCDPPLQQKRMSKEASIASMSTKTQKWVANHHVWFHFCQTVSSTMSGCATEVVMSSHLLWLHTGS